MPFLQHDVNHRFSSWFHSMWRKTDGICYASDTTEVVDGIDHSGWVWGTDANHGYVAGNTYALGATLEYGPYVPYRSLQNGNTGNTPGSSPAWWEVIDDGLGADDDHWVTVPGLNRPTRKDAGGAWSVHMMWHQASRAGVYWNHALNDAQWSMAASGGAYPAVRMSATEDTCYYASVNDPGGYIEAWLYRRVNGVDTLIGSGEYYYSAIPGWAGGSQLFMVYAIGDKIGIAVGTGAADTGPDWPMYDDLKSILFEVTDATISGVTNPYVGVHEVGPGVTMHEWYGGDFAIVETSSPMVSGGGVLVSAGIAGFLALASAALPAMSAVATSEHYNRADIAATIPAQTGSVTAVRGAVLSGASAISPFVSSATGNAVRTGVASATFNPFTAAAGGTVVLAGSGSAIVAVQTASVVGAVGKNVDGEATIPSIVGSATADFAPLGEYIATVAATMPSPYASATDYGIWFASVAASLPVQTGNGEVARGANISAASTMPAISASAGAAYTADANGAAAISAFTGAGTGVRGQVLSGVATMPILAGTATGDAFTPGEVEGSVAAAIPVFASDVTGEVDIAGIGVASIQPITAAGSDIEAGAGIGAATLPSIVASGRGGRRNAARGRGRGHGGGHTASKRETNNVVSSWRHTSQKTNPNRG